MPIKLNVQPTGGSQGAGAQKPVPAPIRPAAPAQSSASTGGVATGSWALPAHTQSSGPTQQHPPHATKPAARTQPPPVLSQLATASAPSNTQQHQTPKPAASSTQSQPSAKDDPLDAPPHSPITPPLHPVKTVTPIPPPTIPPNFASMGGRAPLTHAAHPPTVASAPPPPIPREPIDFENNPDVIALQATVGILLQQKKRAEEDLRKLKDAKNAAMERPLEFARDLMGGGVSQGQVTTEEDDEDEDSDEGEDGDVEMKTEEDGTEDQTPTGTTTNGLKPSALKAKASKKGKGKARAAPAAPPPWANLPKPQDIARMPPINWTQYAVEGEALNKLHNQQLTHPTLGMPAVMGANGTYEFTGAANPDDGKRLVGISAPFDPLRDRVVEKKPKGPSRKGG